MESYIGGWHDAWAEEASAFLLWFQILQSIPPNENASPTRDDITPQIPVNGIILLR